MGYSIREMSNVVLTYFDSIYYSKSNLITLNDIIVGRNHLVVRKFKKIRIISLLGC